MLVFLNYAKSYASTIYKGLPGWLFLKYISTGVTSRSLLNSCGCFWFNLLATKNTKQLYFQLFILLYLNCLKISVFTFPNLEVCIILVYWLIVQLISLYILPWDWAQLLSLRTLFGFRFCWFVWFLTLIISFKTSVRNDVIQANALWIIHALLSCALPFIRLARGRNYRLWLISLTLKGASKLVPAQDGRYVILWAKAFSCCVLRFKLFPYSCMKARLTKVSNIS